MIPQLSKLHALCLGMHGWLHHRLNRAHRPTPRSHRRRTLRSTPVLQVIHLSPRRMSNCRARVRLHRLLLAYPSRGSILDQRRCCLRCRLVSPAHRLASLPPPRSHSDRGGTRTAGAYPTNVNGLRRFCLRQREVQVRRGSLLGSR